LSLGLAILACTSIKCENQQGDWALFVENFSLDLLKIRVIYRDYNYKQVKMTNEMMQKLNVANGYQFS